MASYWVSTSGNDSNSGTSELNAWQTLGKANSTLVAGDDCTIVAGTYAERFNETTSGSAGNTITYQNKTGDTVTVTGAPGVDTIIRMTGAYVIIDGLTADAAELKSDNSALCSTSGANSQFLNMTISGETDWATTTTNINGIYVKGANTTVQAVTLTNISKDVIHFDSSGATDCILDSITATNFQNNGVMFTLNTATVQNIRLLTKNCTFNYSYTSDPFQINGNGMTEGNLRYFVIRDTILRGDVGENGFDGKGSASVLIEGCYIYGSAGDNNGPSDGNDRGTTGGGIQKGDSTRYANDWIIRHNCIYDNFNGVEFDGKVTNTYIYNNNIINNTRDYTGSNSTYMADIHFRGIGSADPGGTNAIKNNIIGQHSKAEVAPRINSMGSNGLDIDYNIYWLVGATDTMFANAVTPTYYNFTNWKTELGNHPTIVLGADANSSVVTSSPFVNVTGTANGDHTALDFRISSGSSAKEAGGSLTLANGAGSSSTALVVDDAYYFYDGYGITGETGDTIDINGTSAVVSSVNSATSITLTAAKTWSDNDPIYYQKYSGTAPHIGALDAAAGGVIPQILLIRQQMGA